MEERICDNGHTVNSGETVCVRCNNSVVEPIPVEAPKVNRRRAPVSKVAEGAESSDNTQPPFDNEHVEVGSSLFDENGNTMLDENGNPVLKA